MSRGQLDEGIKEMDIIINVLLYGLTRKKIQEIVDPLALSEMAFPGAHAHVEDLEKAHDHDHDHDHEHDHDHDHH
jgi:ABC-type Zn2+ transport system substrate-binding protein/surface adhesin